jgi:hypothetical protein
VLSALRERYQKAFRIEKTRTLDEYAALAVVYVKHVIRLLPEVHRVEPAPTATPRHGRRTDAETVRRPCRGVAVGAVR